MISMLRKRMRMQLEPVLERRECPSMRSAVTSAVLVLVVTLLVTLGARPAWIRVQTLTVLIVLNSHGPGLDGRPSF